MKISLLRVLLSAILIFGASSSLFARDYYVATNGADTFTGTSWTDAYKTLTNVFRIATNNSTIYLRGGQTHYTTNTLVWRTNNLTLLGGYEGTNATEPGAYDEINWPSLIVYTNAITNRVFWMVGATNPTLGRVIVTGGRLTNTLTSFGAGMYIENCTNVSVFSTKFLTNIGTVYGAGIAITNSFATISNCVFQANILTNLAQQTYGAGLLVMRGIVNVYDSTINSNFGCGVFFENTTNSLLSGCTITSNRAYNMGGGVFITNSLVTISGCVIRANSATNTAVRYGSGLYVNGAARGAPVQVFDTAIEGNEGDGGVWMDSSTNSLFSGCSISSNRANLNGGGLYLTNSVVTITGCVIRANNLTNGAALRAGGGLFVRGAPVQIFDTVIDGNNGGGVYLDSSTNSLLSGCTINSNMAPQYGAGMFLTNVYVTITNCEFRGNTLTNTLGATYGAGVYQTNGQALYVNTLFDNNRSLAVSPQGMSVYLATGTNRFLNCTFTRHNVEGIRQQPAGCLIEIRNSILWDNGDSLVGVPAGNLYYSDIREGDNVGVNGCISTDPLFGDYFNGDLHLKSQQGRWSAGVWVEDNTNSPCIDAGDINAPYADFANETQPNGGRVNMGCYGNTPYASRTLLPPKMLVTPATYTHYAMRTQNATNRYFTISNTNSYSRKILYNNSTDYGWFSCSPASGEVASDSEITITNLFNTTALGIGSYTGHVTVVGTDSTGNSASNSPATVTVVMNVSPEPSLMVSVTNMSRVTMQGTDAASQGFEVWNAADPSYLVFGMTFTNTSSASWLNCSPANGISYGNHVTVTNIYTTAALAPGVHTATVTVYAAAADYPAYVVTNSPKQIIVTLTVNARPGLARTPATIENFTTIGYNAPSKNISIWNNSPEPRVPMNYTVVTTSDWPEGGMTVDPGNGSSTGEVDSIEVRFNTLYMLSGNYTGRVIMAASGDSTNTPQTTTVILHVNALPECTLDTYTLINYSAEGHDAPSQLFSLWNSSDAPKGLLSYVITDDVPWLQVSPASGVNYGDPTPITVQYNTASLAQGTYHGIITVQSEDASTGAGDMTRQIAVALLVSGRPTLTTSVSRVESSVIQNGVAPQKSFSLWNASSEPRGPMNFVISSDSSWVSPSPGSGITTGEVKAITLNFNSSGLPAGTVTGNLTIVAWDTLTGDAANRSPQTMQVVLTVDPRTPVNYEIPTVSGLPYVRQTLTVNNGYWSPTNTVFSYQWQTADDLAGNNVLDITGATAAGYVIQPQDAGKYIRVRVTGSEYNYSPPLAGTAYSIFSSMYRVKAAHADFDGDGKADLWFYYPPTGTWRLLYSMSTLPTAFDFGWAQTAPLPGDYDGDGLMDIAVYYQAEGLWYIWTAAGAYYSKACGWWAATPVPGDYDGDGATDLAVYHQEQGVWYVLTYTGWFFAQPWGWYEAYPYPADYNGDGITDLAIYYQSAGDWYIKTLAGEILAWKVNFGWYASTPTPGDYDGDGKADLAVYYQAGNLWYFVLSGSGSFAVMSFGTSTGNGMPMPGDYDGDGICDPATVHANGDTIIWCIQQSSQGYRGNSYNLSTGQWR